METLPEECDAESQSVETPCVERTTTETPPHQSPTVSDPEMSQNPTSPTTAPCGANISTSTQFSPHNLTYVPSNGTDKIFLQITKTSYIHFTNSVLVFSQQL